MSKIAPIAATLGALALVGGLVYLPVHLARNEPPRAAKPPAPRTQPPPAVVPDATLVGRNQGRKSWELHARKVVASADGKATTFVGVDRGTLYRDGRPVAQVRAGKVVYDDTAKVLRITDGLRLRMEGITLTTERLNWSTSTGRLRCPTPVTATWKDGAASVVELDGSLVAERFQGRRARLTTKRIPGEGNPAADASIGLILAQPGTADAPPNYKEVHIEHAALWRTDRKARVHTLSGNVVLVHGDTTLRCSKVVYDQKANKATATGGVNVTTPRNVVDGDTADIDFSKRVMRLRSSKEVRIVATPKPATLEAGGERKSTTITARSLDYYYRDKRAEIVGPLTCVDGDQTLTGDTAVWSADEESVLITGNVKGRDGKDQTFEAPSVRVSLKEGAEELEAPDIRATFTVEEEEPSAPAAGP